MPTGIAVAAAFTAGILATAVAVAVGTTHHPLLALVPLGTVVALVAAFTTWTGGIAGAWICWSLHSGFVVGRQAQLDFSSTAQLSAAALLAVALAAGAAGRLVRARRAMVR